ncbi:MAG: rmlC, partial [Herminiimonas sp.]|nr:rmlC [Herminiimonas sp.]
IPEGFAHGFVVTSESAEFLYKTTDYWAPEHERSILWNDPAIGIEWPVTEQPLLSGKDRDAVKLADAEVFA